MFVNGVVVSEICRDAEDEAPLPAGHPLCDYGLRFPDAGEMGSVDSSVMTPDPVSSKHVAVTIANTASSKKSHLENMVKKLVNHYPDNMNKKLSQVSLGNGTIKGIRSALERVHYALLPMIKRG